MKFTDDGELVKCMLGRAFPLYFEYYIVIILLPCVQKNRIEIILEFLLAVSTFRKLYFITSIHRRVHIGSKGIHRPFPSCLCLIDSLRTFFMTFPSLCYTHTYRLLFTTLPLTLGIFVLRKFRRENLLFKVIRLRM